MLSFFNQRIIHGTNFRKSYLNPKLNNNWGPLSSTVTTSVMEVDEIPEPLQYKTVEVIFRFMKVICWFMEVICWFKEVISWFMEVI